MFDKKKIILLISLMLVLAAVPLFARDIGSSFFAIDTVQDSDSIPAVGGEAILTAHVAMNFARTPTRLENASTIINSTLAVAHSSNRWSVPARGERLKGSMSAQSVLPAGAAVFPLFEMASKRTTTSTANPIEPVDAQRCDDRGGRQTQASIVASASSALNCSAVTSGVIDTASPMLLA